MAIPQDKKQFDELVASLKGKNPGRDLRLLAATVDGEKHQVIAKIPNSAEYQSFRDLAADDNTRTRAMPQLVRDCVVHPDSAELDVLLDKRPGLTVTFGSELTKLAGAVEDVESKKL